jgi:hypothetical protein
VEIFSPSSAEMPGIVSVLLGRLLESNQPARSELQRRDGGENQVGGRHDTSNHDGGWIQREDGIGGGRGPGGRGRMGLVVACREPGG